MDCIYLDFEKAFNKVPYRRFLWKIKYIGGFKGTLENYLKGREMTTVVWHEKSE